MEDSWIIRGLEKFMRTTEIFSFGSGSGMEWVMDAPRIGGATMCGTSRSLLVVTNALSNIVMLAMKL